MSLLSFSTEVSSSPLSSPGHSRPKDGVALLAYGRPKDGVALLAYGRPKDGVALLAYGRPKDGVASLAYCPGDPDQAGTVRPNRDGRDKPGHDGEYGRSGWPSSR
jgi:hypothetical protein